MQPQSNLTEVFTSFRPSRSQLAVWRCSEYAADVFGWQGSSWTEQSDDETAALFGYVFKGPTTVTTATSEFHLSTGQYFAVPQPCRIEGGEGLLVRHHQFRPLQQAGGPLEDCGRLRYISGCTDTLLIAPPRLGDPCLNALYFPPNTDQQPHTHPSIRVGMVTKGSGEAVLKNHVSPLREGDIFVILPDGLHSFRTREDEEMVVVAYHPDSDFGPRDEDHPMINRTIITADASSQ